MPDTAKTVLVVDDNVDHADLICAAGKRVAPQVSFQVVFDGQEALDYLHGAHPFEDRTQHPYPSLVLLDLMMPRLDGFRVLARMQAHEPEQPVPVVVLTTSSSPLDQARAMDLGADDFHTKPAGLDGFASLFENIARRWLT